MLTFSAIDANGQLLPLPAALSVTLRMEEDVPADDLYAVFPDTDCGELRSITVSDGGRAVFIGVVDEQEHLYRPAGAFLRISARSLAAHLLDNESPPVNYDHPSATLIYERHVRDYGIGAGDPDDATYFGELNITKGMSQWGVVSAFCSACYASTPRLSADGILYLKGVGRDGRVVFGGLGGIRYTELSDSRRRCEEISRVNVRLGADGYSYPVGNPDALRRGVCRERYLNAMLSGRSIRDADRMIEKGREKSRSLTLKCPGRHTDLLGCGAQVHRTDNSMIDGLYVSAVKYHADPRGEYTTVRLRRRLAECGSQDM